METLSPGYWQEQNLELGTLAPLDEAISSRVWSSPEFPLAQVQGWRWRGATPHPRSGAAADKSYPMLEVRGSSLEEQPHAQGVTAAWVQEG